MKRRPVTSSTVISVGYDPATKILELEFVSGSIYRYFDVPQSIYKSFMAADSKGTFVNDHVKRHFL